MFVFSDAPQSRGRVLDDAVALYRSTIRQVLPLSMIGALLLILPTVVIQMVHGGLDGSEDAGVLLNFGLAWFITMFGYHFVSAAILLKMARSSTNHNYAKSRSTMKTIFGVGAVMSICTLLYLICVWVGTLLLLIPGVIVMVSLALYSPIAILCEGNPLKSLGTSHTLVWGCWWRTATILKTVYVIYMVFSMLPYAIMGIFAGAQTLGVMENPPVSLQLASAVINGFVLPLVFATIVVCMHDLRMRRFGTDLEARLSG